MSPWTGSTEPGEGSTSLRNRELQRQQLKGRRKRKTGNFFGEWNGVGGRRKAEAINSFLWELIYKSLPWTLQISSFVSGPILIVFCIPN